MKRYKTDRAIVRGYINREQPTGDVSRIHAINQAIAAIVLVFCGYVLVWMAAKLLIDAIPAWSLFMCVPLSLLAGASWGAVKLIAFTEMHRAYLYGLESVLGIDVDGDSVVGEPTEKRGTLLVGIDGTYHRIDTSLSMGEIDAVKRLLLLSKKATVRSLTAIVGDRKAAQLRTDLIGLRICTKPEQNNAAAMLSPAGEQAVKQW